MDSSRSNAAATAMVVGGILAGAVFLPFTIAHGPTSYNLEREVLGWDMHNWGFLMGTLPPLLIGAGLWSLRGLVAGERRSAFRALTVMCVAMLLFAAMNFTFRAFGPPFDLFLLAPAGVVAALTVRKGPIRLVLGLLATAYFAALAMVLIPLETSDSFRGFRVFGVIAYAGVGVLWAALGVTLLSTEHPRRRARLTKRPRSACQQPRFARSSGAAGTWANWGATLLAGIWGTGKVTPISSGGRTGKEQRAAPSTPAGVGGGT